MKVECHWNEKMKFTAQSGDHTVVMDAKSPLGSDSGPSPKSLVLVGLAGCTGMDVIALLRKYKQTVTAMEIEADAPTTETHPQVFQKVDLIYRVAGSMEPQKLIEAVHLSMSKYCGVSAMVAQAAPISYQIQLNGSEIHRGHADFAELEKS